MALGWQHVLECAFAGTGGSGGEETAFYKEDGGGAPVEDLFFEGAHAEAVGVAAVEGAEASEEVAAFDEEGELAQGG